MLEKLHAEVVLVFGTTLILTSLLIVGLACVNRTEEALVDIVLSGRTILVLNRVTQQEVVLQVR